MQIPGYRRYYKITPTTDLPHLCKHIYRGSAALYKTYYATTYKKAALRERAENSHVLFPRYSYRCRTHPEAGKRNRLY